MQHPARTNAVGGDDEAAVRHDDDYARAVVVTSNDSALNQLHLSH